MPIRSRLSHTASWTSRLLENGEPLHLRPVEMISAHVAGKSKRRGLSCVR